VADDEFRKDESRLDRFSEADVGGDEHRDPRHPKGLEERDELEVLDLDARVEGRRDGKQSGRTGFEEMVAFLKKHHANVPGHPCREDRPSVPEPP